MSGWFFSQFKPGRSNCTSPGALLDIVVALEYEIEVLLAFYRPSQGAMG
jgi:hypothetical protein